MVDFSFDYESLSSLLSNLEGFGLISIKALICGASRCQDLPRDLSHVDISSYLVHNQRISFDNAKEMTENQRNSLMGQVFAEDVDI